MAEDLRLQVNKSKRTIYIILILLLLLIIAALLYLLYSYLQGQPDGGQVNVNINQPVQLPTDVPGLADFNQPDPGVVADLQIIGGNAQAPQAEENIELFAASFAERFGTYSNQGNFNNFNDLEIFMTDSVKNWVFEQHLPQLRSAHSDYSKYYAVQTKAVSTQVNSFNETTGKGEVVVKTQRAEYNESITNPSVRYQDILIKMEKINDQWQVAGAFWQ